MHGNLTTKYEIFFVSVFIKPKPKLLIQCNGPFAASSHMVHAGGQAAHWDIQNKENSNLS